MAAGEDAFNSRCKKCHTVGAGEGSSGNQYGGPNLFGIYELVSSENTASKL